MILILMLSAEGIQVHDGFQQTFERTADGVLAGVQNGLSTKNATNVLVTGHSLGTLCATFDWNQRLLD